MNMLGPGSLDKITAFRTWTARCGTTDWVVEDFTKEGKTRIEAIGRINGKKGVRFQIV
jgi:hypothetical protein